jgi:hypothetical protein
MQPVNGTFCQQTIKSMLNHQPSQAMMNFVSQHYPPSAGTAPMMQQPTLQVMPMTTPYYALNQQPYYAPNHQQQPGYF